MRVNVTCRACEPRVNPTLEYAMRHWRCTCLIFTRIFIRSILRYVRQKEKRAQAINKKDSFYLRIARINHRL